MFKHADEIVQYFSASFISSLQAYNCHCFALAKAITDSVFYFIINKKYPCLKFKGNFDEMNVKYNYSLCFTKANNSYQSL